MAKCPSGYAAGSHVTIDLYQPPRKISIADTLRSHYLIVEFDSVRKPFHSFLPRDTAIMAEQTYIMIKPDGVQRGLVRFSFCGAVFFGGVQNDLLLLKLISYWSHIAGT